MAAANPRSLRTSSSRAAPSSVRASTTKPSGSTARRSHLSPRSFEASRALGILLNLKGQYPEARTPPAACAQASRPRRSCGTRRWRRWRCPTRSKASSPTCCSAVRRRSDASSTIDSDACRRGGVGTVAGPHLLEAGDIATAAQMVRARLRGMEAASRVSLTASSCSGSCAGDTCRRASPHARARSTTPSGCCGEFEAIMQKRGTRQRGQRDLPLGRRLRRVLRQGLRRAIAELRRATDRPVHPQSDRPMAYEAKGDMTNARQYYRRRLESNVHNLQSAIARPHARAKLSGPPSQ